MSRAWAILSEVEIQRCPTAFTRRKAPDQLLELSFRAWEPGLILDGISYEAKRTRIDTIREPAGVESRYTVTGITIRSNGKGFSGSRWKQWKRSLRFSAA